MTRYLPSQRVGLLAALLLAGVASTLYAQTITAFDPPNSTYTVASAINGHGQITGYYSDGDVPHGFLRKRDGSYITFDAFSGGSFPSNAFPLEINAAGQITGYYVNDLTTGSFLRQTNGTIIKFYPGAPISPDTASSPSAGNGLSSSCGDGSVAVAINDLGQITGGWPGAGGNCSGYIRQPNGTITSFDVRSEFHPDDYIPTTNPRDINFFGQITGEYLDGDRPSGAATRGFLRQPNGKIVRFDVPGPVRTYPRAINLFGQIAGYYQDSNSVVHGFLRQPNGNIVTFDPAGATYTEANSINLAGQITGFYLGADGIYHGFLRNWDGALTVFDAPNSQSTFAESINLFGQITGYYFDGSSYHGFVRSAR